MFSTLSEAPATHNVMSIPSQNQTGTTDQRSKTSVHVKDYNCERYTIDCRNYPAEVLVYKPLSSPSVARVFTLFPGQAGDCLRGTLTEVDVDNPSVAYLALSYAWGSIEKPHFLECDGKLVGIPCSLNSALHRLRHAEEPVALFCDAVCIDQDGLRERERQIGVMGRVYANAQYVIADLGEEFDEWDESLEYLRQVALNTGSLGSLLRRTTVEPPSQIPPATPRAIKGLAILCRREWSRRLWIVQEFILARRVSFLVGWKCYDAEMFCTGMLQAFIANADVQNPPEDWLDSFLSVSRGAERFSRLNMTRNLYRKSETGSLSLSYLLASMLPSKVTVLSDKIYGLMGLLSKREAAMIKVDYHRPDWELFTSISRHLIQEGDIVLLFHYMASLNVMKNQPSWCFNPIVAKSVSALDKSIYWDFIHGNDMRRRFKASGSTTIKFRFVDDQTLGLSGRIIDFVSEHATAWPSYNEDLPNQSSAIRTSIEQTMNEMALAARTWLGNTGKVRRRLWTTLCTEGRTEVGNHTTDTAFPYVQRHLDSLEVVHRIQNSTEFEDALQPSGAEVDRASEDAGEYWLHAGTCLPLRKLGLTDKKKLCLLPHGAIAGDVVAIFDGFPTPFILRPTENHFGLIGSAYVEGMMDGEAYENTSIQSDEILLD